METLARDVKVCVPTDELLHQVAKSVSLHVPFLSATVSSNCTWKTAIAAAESSFGDSDREISLHSQPRFGSRKILQQIAKSNALSPQSPLNTSSSFGLPIRTTVDFRKIGVPKKASESARRVLRKEAQSWPDLPPPHTLTIRASIVESLLPVVSANINMYGLDATADDPHVSLTQAELFWDTEAHSTVVVDERNPGPSGRAGCVFESRFKYQLCLCRRPALSHPEQPCGDSARSENVPKSAGLQKHTKGDSLRSGRESS